MTDEQLLMDELFESIRDEKMAEMEQRKPDQPRGTTTSYSAGASRIIHISPKVFQDVKEETNGGSNQ